MTERRASPLVRAFWLGFLVVPAVAIALMVTDSGEEIADAAADLPPCSSAKLPRSGDRINCSTGDTRLTIAGERRPLVLDGTHVRVLSSELDGRTLSVTMRIRNTERSERAPFADGQLYVNVAGSKALPTPIVGNGEIGGREAIRVRFRLDARPARRLRSGDARADLGVVPRPFVGDTDSPALGVVRLEPDGVKTKA